MINAVVQIGLRELYAVLGTVSSLDRIVVLPLLSFLGGEDGLLALQVVCRGFEHDAVHRRRLARVPRRRGERRGQRQLREDEDGERELQPVHHLLDVMFSCAMRSLLRVREVD